jgi:4-amino-4-deoxy-L-arabinose transferase-like glycosyltransferase
VAIAVRPLLPIDETRYIAVAWESFVREDWFAPLTLNFEPYYHKPSLLFWLINACWAIFGVSRWAATIPAIAASVAVVCLTTVLCHRLLPAARKHIVYVIVGSLPLTIYGSAIMFDTILTAWILGAVVFMHEYARTGRKTRLVPWQPRRSCSVAGTGPLMAAPDGHGCRQQSCVAVALGADGRSNCR